LIILRGAAQHLYVCVCVLSAINITAVSSVWKTHTHTHTHTHIIIIMFEASVCLNQLALVNEPQVHFKLTNPLYLAKACFASFLKIYYTLIFYM